jgi:hypothetical protein
MRACLRGGDDLISVRFHHPVRRARRDKTMAKSILTASGEAPMHSNSRPLVVLEEEFAATLKNDLPNVVTRGELLIEIKTALGRGKWLPWLAGKFALSESTAQNYMNAARFVEKYPTVRDLKISPSILYGLAAKYGYLTPDQLNVIFEAAKDRWVGTEDVTNPEYA